MIPEIAHFNLLLALTLSGLSILAGGWAVQKNCKVAALLVQRASLAMTLLIISSFAILLYSFFKTDLTVVNVYQHAHETLPWYYRLTAAWGSHEGSMMLWLSILSLWTLSFLITTKFEDRLFIIARMVLAFIFLGLLAFVLATSNPFERFLPVTPAQGLDLNPLLQDPGMILHPPLLYMGYVGFAIPFALAVAVLYTGAFRQDVKRYMRKVILFGWAFLTFGITLGSYWAYYELGWGGWWFWDPVENASLLPWLAGCALLHSINVSNNRKIFYGWTLLLAILTFALSLLGTFLVRSGVLTSVHSFANDPERGMFILALLGLYTMPALVLYALRANRFTQASQFPASSREGFLLLNNILFIVMTATVLLGTIYPLLIEGLGLGFIAVGAPYFNTVIVPMGLILAFALGFAPMSSWLQGYKFSTKVMVVIILALAFVLSISLALRLPFLLIAVLLLSAWIITHSAIEIIFRKNKSKTPLSYWGMHLAHIGVVVSMLGIAVSSHYKIERDVSMQIGDTISIQDYTFTMSSLQGITGPNYIGERALFDVKYQEKSLPIMKPEKRFYQPRELALSQTAIFGHRGRDLYIALSEPLGENQWAVRLHYKPLVRWIWYGGVLIAFGALLAWFDRKYLVRKT
jgi:cytochrome c-type biogenesis protein CcmF